MESSLQDLNPSFTRGSALPSKPQPPLPDCKTDLPGLLLPHSLPMTSLILALFSVSAPVPPRPETLPHTDIPPSTTSLFIW